MTQGGVSEVDLKQRECAASLGVLQGSWVQLLKHATPVPFMDTNVKDDSERPRTEVFPCVKARLYRVWCGVVW